MTEYVFDVDIAGVNRSSTLIKNAFWTEWWRNNKKQPMRVAKRYIFTYWDEDSKMYRYKPLHQLDLIDLDGDKYIRDQHGFPGSWKMNVLNGCPPVTGKMVGRWLDIMTEDSIYPEMGGINWKQIWMKMDFMRTGLIRSTLYHEGERSLCYLKGSSVPYISFSGDICNFDTQGCGFYDELEEISDEDYYDY